MNDKRVDQALAPAKQLCKWLGYLPLGVELVGRYLARKPDPSLAVLWQRLQDKRLDAIAFKQAEPGMTASLGVAAAFELSWQGLDESAQQVATVLSLFALVEIPWTLVEQCLPEIDAEELEEIRDQQPGHRSAEARGAGAVTTPSTLAGIFCGKAIATGR